MRNLRRVLLAVCFIFSLAFICSLTGCVHPVPKQLTIRYAADNGGSIGGMDVQILYEGCNTEPVTAIPENGYYFTVWSDGVKTPERKETNISEDLLLTAYFDKCSYQVTYSAGPNGLIDGKAEQIVKYQETAESVEAVPNTGFMFIEWSDGLAEPARRDTVSADFSVTAYFDTAVKTFDYDYNYATGNCSEKSVTFRYDAISEIKSLPVPQKEYSIFGGWYLDKDRTIQVADETGKLMIGSELFENDSKKFYAKWTATENASYSVLLVFADHINGAFESKDGTLVDVNYKLSSVERKICEQIHVRFSQLLKELFYGYIDVEVDAYFTTQPLGRECFTKFYTVEHLDYDLNAFDIPEVVDKLPNYRSAICLFSFDDLEYNLHSITGIGGNKFASLHLDSLLETAIINNIPLETFLDPSIERWEGLHDNLWKGVLGSVAHEFTHTIEVPYGYYNYHNAIETDMWNQLSVTKLYLMNQFLVDGERVGIPMDFWKGDIEVWANYYPTAGGKIEGSTMVYKVTKFGGDLEPVTAAANPGYRFVKWSDGVTSPTRQDKNVTSFVYLYAIFEKIE